MLYNNKFIILYISEPNQFLIIKIQIKLNSSY
jgi:hypothetical protein